MRQAQQGQAGGGEQLVLVAVGLLGVGIEMALVVEFDDQQRLERPRRTQQEVDMAAGKVAEMLLAIRRLVDQPDEIPQAHFGHDLIVAGDYEVMSKVRLWDFIWLVNEPPDRKQHLGHLSCRHVDFLLCTPGSLKPLLVIELDDKSHLNAYAQEADRYKNELFAAAGLPLLRLPHPNFPPRQLRAKIEEQLDISN